MSAPHEASCNPLTCVRAFQCHRLQKRFLTPEVSRGSSSEMKAAKALKAMRFKTVSEQQARHCLPQPPQDCQCTSYAQHRSKIGIPLSLSLSLCCNNHRHNLI